MNDTIKKLNKVRKFILARALNVVTGMCKIYAPETLEDWKAIRDNLKNKVGIGK